ncbi:MAG: sigma-70 family RNA polymerase sigma factor [Actinoplanes sp.]
MTDVFLAEAQAGDAEAFRRLVEPLRSELHAHCYRMLGSAHDADDALQDALVRAWRGLAGFQSRSSVRTWLYTVATRTCLDAAAARGRRALPVDLGPASPGPVDGDAPAMEVAWLGPYPDTPDVRYERRETIELAFVAALQHLPGNQRAALVLFEVLGFSVAEIAGMMDTSTTSVNSALARARRVVAERVPAAGQVDTADSRQRELAAGFAEALERGDADALVALLTADVTWSMPPLPHWYQGVEAVMGFAVAVPLASCGEWRHPPPMMVNRQPAVASYRRVDGDHAHRAWSVDVLTVRDGRIAGITAFIGDEHFTLLGLPLVLH